MLFWTINVTLNYFNLMAYCPTLWWQDLYVSTSSNDSCQAPLIVLSLLEIRLAIQDFPTFLLQVNLFFYKLLNKILTNPFPCMLQAERQLMTDVEHRHTALCVVWELGSTVLKQELIHIIHDVANAVLRAWKGKAGACICFPFPVAAHSFHQHRQLGPADTSQLYLHDTAGNTVNNELGSMWKEVVIT